MTKPIELIAQIPMFPGFYESEYSADVDHEESQWIEYHCDPNNEHSDPDYEGAHAEELRISESEMFDLMYRATDYSAAYRKLAEWHVDAFDYHAGQALGLTVKAKRKVYDYESKTMKSEVYNRPSIGMRFESMDSPREYNFTTDRVYGYIPLKIVRELFKRSKAQGHATLKEVIKERHESRSGFISYYTTDLDEWTFKPLQDWDHNELVTLLLAGLRMAGVDLDDFDQSVRYSTLDDGAAMQAWESAVDWPKFEAARDELRQEKAEEAGIIADGGAMWRDGPPLPHPDQQPLPFGELRQ